MKYGMIAGNGRFPILALESARQAGDEVIVVAIKEEASSEVQPLASQCHWISLGELSKLIDICHNEGVTQIMMAGQVKHARIFSSIKPDWRLLKVLAVLDRKNTDALIGAVTRVLSDEGIELVDSTRLLKHLLAPSGVLTKRKPDKDEQANIEYGRRIAHALAAMDLGQSVAIANRACVAIEAMEGTDAMLRRAASLVEGTPLTLVKSASRRHHLLFDVPVVGPLTIETMRETNTTALAIDAQRTLMLDKDELLAAADRARIAVLALS
jgi:DUF1009 family protein